MKLGFLTLLTLIFVIAKLAGWITWSWWLVLLPAILSFAIGIGVFLIVIVLAAFVEWGKSRR